ncbi:MAG TPA: hypothetical protein VH325_08915 [Bryobacteraceae bacterium]|jgi:hypothetical protein|nr:hypothetical protein [Bryobacteraceae bacterium]
MEREENNTGELVRLYKGGQAQALSDARMLGFEQEFEAGVYSRTQVSQWAGEQWLVWLEAAAEDRLAAESVETEESEGHLVPVRVRKTRPV